METTATLSDNLGDINLDDIFADPNIQAPTNNQVEPTPPTPQATPEEPLLKTATGTVYKTVDDARRGIEHKDALIERLRQDAIQRTGVDPVTGQPVYRVEQPASYLSNGKKYVEDLAAAAQQGDPDKYVEVQTRLQSEVMAPYLPLLTEFAKSKAIEQVARTNETARTFIGSEDYNKTLEGYGSLKQAIAYAETNPSAAGNLAELYSIAMALNASRKLPEVVRAAHTGAQPTRPTVTSSVTQPPPTNNFNTTPAGLETSDGRKALIAEQERAGVANLRF